MRQIIWQISQLTALIMFSSACQPAQDHYSNQASSAVASEGFPIIVKLGQSGIEANIEVGAKDILNLVGISKLSYAPSQPQTNISKGLPATFAINFDIEFRSDSYNCAKMENIKPNKRVNSKCTAKSPQPNPSETKGDEAAQVPPNEELLKDFKDICEHTLYSEFDAPKQNCTCNDNDAVVQLKDVLSADKKSIDEKNFSDICWGSAPVQAESPKDGDLPGNITPRAEEIKRFEALCTENHQGEFVSSSMQPRCKCKHQNRDLSIEDVIDGLGKVDSIKFESKCGIPANLLP